MRPTNPQQQPQNPQMGQPQQPPQYQQAPGFMSYGAQAAYNAGPGQSQKFAELSGLHMTHAAAMVPGIIASTATLAIPTYAESARLGIAAQYGTNNMAYRTAAGFAKFDIARMGIGGFGSSRIGSTASLEALSSMATLDGAASPLLNQYGQLSGRTLVPGQAGVQMHALGMNASYGKRLNAFIGGGARAFSAETAAIAGGEVVTFANQATLNAFNRKGLGEGLLRGVENRGFARTAKFARGARGLLATTAGFTAGIAPLALSLMASEAVIGTGVSMYQGAADASMGQRLMEEFAPEGMSYGSAEARNFGSNFNALSRSHGMEMGEMAGMLGSMSQMGTFTGAKDMKEFKQKLTTQLKQLKQLAKETALTMQEAQQLTAGLKQQGVLSGNIPQVGAQMMGLSAATGVGLDRLMQAGTFGRQQAMQAGTSLDMGYVSAQRSVAGMNMLVNAGGLTESQQQIIQMMGGADEAGLAITGHAKRLAPMMAFALEKSGKDSEGFDTYAMNQTKLEKFMRGGYSRKELEKMMADPSMGAKTSAFMANTELYSQSVEQMQEAMVNFGLQNSSADYTASEIIAKTFNMHKNHAELLINHHTAMQAADANTGIEIAKANRQTTRNAFDNRQSPGFGRSLDIMYESAGLPKLGRSLADITTRGVEFVLGQNYAASPDAYTRAASLRTTRNSDAFLAGEGSFDRDLGFMSANYGIFSAFNEDERERISSAYGKRFGGAVGSTGFGVEGRDYVLGDAGIMEDLGRLTGLGSDRREIDLAAVRQHKRSIRQFRGSIDQKFGKSKGSIQNYFADIAMNRGSRPFEEFDFLSSIGGATASMERGEIDAEVQKFEEATGIKLTGGKGLTAGDQLAQLIMEYGSEVGLDSESALIGFNQVRDAGEDDTAFLINSLKKREAGLASTSPLTQGDAYELGFGFGHKGFGITATGVNTFSDYKNLSGANKKFLRDAVRQIAMGKKSASDFASEFQKREMGKQYKGILDQESQITGKRRDVLKHLRDLENMDVGISGVIETRDRNFEIQEVIDTMGGEPGTGGGLNRFLSGDLSRAMVNYSEESGSERRDLTSRILRELTDQEGNDAAQRAGLIKAGVSEVYSLTKAYDALTGNDAAKRQQLMEAYQISGNGKKAFTREEALDALSKFELANFKGSEEQLKRDTIASKPMVSPREFKISMDEFVTSLKDFTKVVQANQSLVAGNGDAKESK